LVQRKCVGIHIAVHHPLDGEFGLNPGAARPAIQARQLRNPLSGLGDVERGSYDGRNFHFGIREHAMGASLNGMVLHGGLRPFGATFFIFSDYMRPSVRLAALMKIHSIYVWTHDSVGLGEDGPTHQPIEHLASLREIPGQITLRTGDATEVVESWKLIMKLTHEPVAVVLSRQN